MLYEVITDKFFNVYTDIKNKLIENGIPENEIAFIHDANNDAQKATLFSKVSRITSYNVCYTKLLRLRII